MFATAIAHFPHENFIMACISSSILFRLVDLKIINLV